MVKRKREEDKRKAVETGAGEEQSEKQNDDQHTLHTNPSLPWMRKPLDLDGFPALAVERVAGLDHRLVKALQENGISSLFPVQVAVWQLTIGHGGGERDICLCSPTGSGKTLAYALPIIQRLSSRVVRRLRALIVLPTRDLAMQVKAVFDVLAPAVGLAVGLAIGQTQMATEASELVSITRECEHYLAKAEAKLLDLVESCVDILVATPGRLVDHISSTKNFTLDYLNYLVIDEADRLLRQSYQEWLPITLNKIRTQTCAGSTLLKGIQRGFSTTRHHQVMKMVVSATLTKDPSKISQIGLCFPIFLSANVDDNKRYQLPEQLQSYRLVGDADTKPLHLIILLHLLKDQKTIIFTASVVATHRLFLLLGCLDSPPFKAVEYSSYQHQHSRSKSLADFRSGHANVLVASDGMTRGMDVEGIMNVINYDVPVYAKTYVHRVGRTARAGRSGSSYTLLRKEEVKHFKELLKKIDHGACKDFKLQPSAVQGLYPSYLEALEKLKDMVANDTVKPSG